MFDNLNQEVISLFSSFSGHGLQFVREDMGLNEGDLLMMEEHLSKEEIAILNLEVTPQIHDILEKAMFAHALSDKTTWEQERARSHAFYDHDRVVNSLAEEELDSRLDKLSEIQSRMAVGMEKFIQPTKAAVDEIQERLDAAHNGQRLPADEFFGLISKIKDRRAALSRYWDHWNGLNDMCRSVTKGEKRVWALYFAMEQGEENWTLSVLESMQDEEINRYFVSGETENVDDYSLMANDAEGIMDMLALAHLQEMKEFDAPEARGIGFWNFKEEFKTNHRAVAKQRYQEEDDAFWASVMSVPVQEEQAIELF